MMTPSAFIDLNADVGEGYDDLPLFRIVTSVNIACGAHAGDPATMRRAVDAAAEHGVAVGAHPGYADPDSMGRRPMTLSPYQIERLIVGQVHALEDIAAAAGVRVRHVKPHGALYNQAAADATIARAVAAAVAAIDPALTLVGMGESIAAGRAAGLAVAREAFCDRGYRPDGTLIPRDQPGALIEDIDAAAAQAVALAQVKAADTICLHGDTPGAAERAAAVRAALHQAGIEVRSF